MSIRSVVISIIAAGAIVALALLAYIRYESFPEKPDAFAPAPTVPAPQSGSETSFRFEIVATEAARTQGLSGRREVPSGYGMLFVFDRADRYGFWMKDMYVPIDIIWLADDGTVLAIDEAVAPETYPTPFYPPRPVRLVLETKAGEARAQGWNVGTRIPLPH